MVSTQTACSLSSDYSPTVSKLTGDMDVEEFFLPEEHWLSQSPFKEIEEKRNRWLADMKRQREEAERAKINAFLNRRPVRRGPRF